MESIHVHDFGLSQSKIIVIQANDQIVFFRPAPKTGSHHLKILRGQRPERLADFHEIQLLSVV
ncbi:hypothetical protein CU048_01700 [Beijerinckiaceae bacterium]|nr:hypothetical protein CU048_01700 [Beijerinckiaceae bacterium]